MRIRFIKHEDYDLREGVIGTEWQGETVPVGHTVVSGYFIASNGVLKPFVEDITQFNADGNEIVPEPVDDPSD